MIYIHAFASWTWLPALNQTCQLKNIASWLKGSIVVFRWSGTHLTGPWLGGGFLQQKRVRKNATHWLWSSNSKECCLGIWWKIGLSIHNLVFGAPNVHDKCWSRAWSICVQSIQSMAISMGWVKKFRTRHSYGPLPVISTKKTPFIEYIIPFITSYNW